MRYVRYLPLLVVIAFVVWLVAGWIRYALLSDEEKIRHTVHELIEAAERRDIGDLLAPVAEDYRDPYHPDREALRFTLIQLALRFQRVEVRLHELSVDTTVPLDAPSEAPPEAATVLLRATVLFGLEPDRPATIRFVEEHWGSETFFLEFRKREHGWQIVRARRSDDP